MPVESEYCILNDGITAVIEMVPAAGISLLDKKQLNPLKTTTFIGGSATNDGGAGMLQAL